MMTSYAFVIGIGSESRSGSSSSNGFSSTARFVSGQPDQDGHSAPSPVHQILTLAVDRTRQARVRSVLVCVFVMTEGPVNMDTRAQ